MEKRELTYNERLYKMLLPPVRQCMVLANRVICLLGLVAGTLKKDVADGGLQSFGAALQTIDPEKLDSLMMDAVAAGKLSCNGENISNGIYFEKHFGQFREDVYPVCFWAIWECVRDFLPHSLTSKAFIQGVQAKVAKALASAENGSLNGGSGDQSGPDSVPGSK